MKKFNLVLVLCLVVFFLGCEKKAATDVHEVHWDRDMCKRCVMVISDRTHAVQVINPKTKRSYMFDDIGCWILWAQEEKIDWEDNATIWITDGKSGDWLDAKNSYYDTENVTPMAYGFMAHKTKEEIKKDQEIITYDEVRRRVIKIGK